MSKIRGNQSSYYQGGIKLKDNIMHTMVATHKNRIRYLFPRMYRPAYLSRNTLLGRSRVNFMRVPPAVSFSGLLFAPSSLPLSLPQRGIFSHFLFSRVFEIHCTRADAHVSRVKKLLIHRRRRATILANERERRREFSFTKYILYLYKL